MLSKFVLLYLAVAVAMAKPIQQNLRVTCESVPGTMTPDEATFLVSTLIAVHNSIPCGDGITFESGAVTEQVWHQTKWAKQAANLRANSSPNVGTGQSTSYADYRIIIGGSCNRCARRSLSELLSPSCRENFESAFTNALVAGAAPPFTSYFAQIRTCRVELINQVELTETGYSVHPEAE